MTSERSSASARSRGRAQTGTEVGADESLPASIGGADRLSVAASRIVIESGMISPRLVRTTSRDPSFVNATSGRALPDALGQLLLRARVDQADVAAGLAAERERLAVGLYARPSSPALGRST